ncbi:hypothetical protein ACFOZ0_01685 [Streptomyces yaanensis]|uniref:Uncharacterized protein n=1 Tax=Streptomyces yaanensis TaxID=1142239 RepID=A0ABV7S998_9ACTN
MKLTALRSYMRERTLGEDGDEACSRQEAEARTLLLRMCSLLLQYPDTELTAAKAVLTATVEALSPSPTADC